MTKNRKGLKFMDVISNFFDKITGAFVSFNFPSDLFDILLVAFVIYETIKIIKGSRSFQLLKGIALLAILFVIVKMLNMEASEYLLSVVFENALIILVVLFSPDIRKILEKFGRQSIKELPFFGFRSNAELEKNVKDMINGFCKATVDMSETKTGALVVFERKAPLKDIVASGTMLDAVSSPELFNGIFFKNSALHDGAVVVRDARILAAGCILPLTQNPTLASELGTRHRAAIGISEQSDAVVVVVSEETGHVSVAINGTLQRDVENGVLREILLRELIEDDAKTENKDKKKKRKNKGGDNDEK